MNAYASVSDYELRYGALGPTDEARIQALLDDTALKVDALVERHSVDADAHAAVLKALSCDYVHYRVQFAIGSNLSAVTHQAGSFQETYSMRTELGFDKWARRYYGDSLGISGGTAFTVKVGIHDSAGNLAGDLNDW